MRSSSGEHWLALDQVRALAAFLVFCWHFLHHDNGMPVAFSSAPVVFPLAVFDEGQTGVALFMTLSGYLFAKLLGKDDVRVGAFLWNRMLRLLPLAAFVFVAMLIEDLIVGGMANVRHELLWFVAGIIVPTIPLNHGFWSILVEAHFYLLLPFLIAAKRRLASAPILIALAATAWRAILVLQHSDVPFLAYWTLIGRIDQFALGMAAFSFRDRIAGRDRLAVLVALSFTGFYGWLDWHGGTHWQGAPRGDLLWTFLPLIEGAAYAFLIGWYDARGRAAGGRIGRAIGAIGGWSYSLYLWHFFFVFRAAAWIDAHIMSIANFYVGLLWATLCFVALTPLGWLSFRYIEQPFLRLRRPYRKPPKPILTPRPIAI